MLSADDIQQRLTKALPDAKVKATDLTGGGDHWQVAVTCKAFEDKSLIEQHQMIYAALGEWMKKEIHALAIHTSSTE